MIGRLTKEEPKCSSPKRKLLLCRDVVKEKSRSHLHAGRKYPQTTHPTKGWHPAYVKDPTVPYKEHK